MSLIRCKNIGIQEIVVKGSGGWGGVGGGWISTVLGRSPFFSQKYFATDSAVIKYNTEIYVAFYSH